MTIIVDFIIIFVGLFVFAVAIGALMKGNVGFFFIGIIIASANFTNITYRVLERINNAKV